MNNFLAKNVDCMNFLANYEDQCGFRPTQGFPLNPSMEIVRFASNR